MVKVGRYNYVKSTAKGKKLMTEVNGKKIHFGSASSGHYKDKTGIWKSKDHGDEKRRASFRARMGGVRKRDGSRAVDDPTSPAWHSLRILW